MLTYADACRSCVVAAQSVHLEQRQYDVCWRMLTYAVVCGRLQEPQLSVKSYKCRGVGSLETLQVFTGVSICTFVPVKQVTYSTYYGEAEIQTQRESVVGLGGAGGGGIRGLPLAGSCQHAEGQLLGACHSHSHGLCLSRCRKVSPRSSVGSVA